MSRLKTSWIVIANVALMCAILAFVVLYSNFERKENYQHQVEHFVNSTIAMERVTGNYLEGEQGICDNWAQYINSQDMTLKEAAEYVRATHAKGTTSAHLIDMETLTGYSSRPKPNTEDDYDVSYTRMDLIGDGSWIADLGEAINITRTFTNPLNGEQSLAFCNRITVRDPETKEGHALTDRERFDVINHTVLDITAHNKVNFMLYDGDLFYVHKNMKNNMFVKCLGQSLLFATSPLDDQKWEPVPLCQLLAYKNGRQILTGTIHPNEYIADPKDMKLIFLDYATL